MKYGYAPMSTVDQNGEMQLKALEWAGVGPENISKTSYPAGDEAPSPAALSDLEA